MEWKDRKKKIEIPEKKKKKKDQWLQATAQEPEEFPKEQATGPFRRW